MKKMIGNVNGLVLSSAWAGAKRFDFDGTTVGLAKAATANGVRAGDKFLANFGGRLRSNASNYVLEAAPHEIRTGGVWAERV